MNEHSPIVSEFATPEEAAAYEQWLREKVAASLADQRPNVPHDEVMAEMRAIIKAKGRLRRVC
ncbi:MAG TPA: stability determinant [Allosphingosinicella sp.]